MKRIKGEVVLAAAIVYLSLAFIGLVAANKGEKAPETPAVTNYNK